MSGWTYALGELSPHFEGSVDATNVSFTGVSTDTRTLKPGQVFFALTGDNFDGNKFVAEAFARGAVAAVTTRAHPAGPCLVVERPLAVLQSFAAEHRAGFAGPVVAITGSAGKTTTKDLTAALLATRMRVTRTEGNLNNDIGVPLTLLSMGDDCEAVVVEMGANHKGEIAQLCAMARPTESTITMIGEAHLEGFGSLDDVESAKGEIATALEPDGTFYVNANDARCRRVAERTKAHKVYVGDEGDVAMRDCRFDDDGELLLTLDPIGRLKLPLSIRAHAMNVALAVAIGLQHGVTEFEAPLREACRSARRFRVVSAGPLTILDDTYNANPVSMRAALRALAERTVPGIRMAALGDMLELGPESASLHAEIGRVAAECGISRLYVRGDFAKSVADAARTAGVRAVEIIDSHDAMADAIATVAGPGDCLLVKGSRGMRMEKVIERLRAGDAASLGAGSAEGRH